MKETAQELTRAIASGDTEAFARFYRDWFDFMLACARQSVRRDEGFCLDVVQDACCKLIRSLKPVPDEASLRRYIAATIQSCAYDRLRVEKRRLQREQAFARDRNEEATADTGLDEDLAWLRAQLEQLDEPQLNLLVMRHRFGWTLERIGQALGLKPGAVDGRLGRLTTGLRKNALETMDDECPAK
ncbi:MAG: RNA polymerase sigma factor [Phycisphaerales bacterium JB038]